MLAALLLIGGLGGAAFHPPAAALVHAVSGDRKGLAMSTHISGGSLGFALAPLVFAPAVVCAGTVVGVAGRDPGLFALVYTLRLMRRVEIPRKRAKAGLGGTCGRTPSRSALLYIIVVLRTLTANSLSVFLPVLLTRQGMGVSEASAAVSLYLFVSTVGGFLGGPLADRYGARRVIIGRSWRRCRFCSPGSSHGLDADAAGLGWRVPAAVDAAGQRDLRPADRAGQRGHGLVADDGVCVGRRLAAGAGGRRARRQPGAERRAVHHRRRPTARGAARPAAAERAPSQPPSRPLTAEAVA